MNDSNLNCIGIIIIIPYDVFHDVRHDEDDAHHDGDGHREFHVSSSIC